MSLYPLLLLVLFVVGWISGSIDLLRGALNIDSWFDHFTVDSDADAAVVLRMRQEQFSSLVEAWNTCISARSGEVPADPYAALFYAAKLSDGRPLREITFFPDLPPRLNPNLGENAKWIIFLANYDVNGPEQWQYYADGTWARVPVPAAATYTPLGIGLSFDPRERLRDSGYPVDDWKTDADRAKWLSKNHDRLVWYPPWRMYVVEGAPTTRPASASSQPTR